MSAKRRECQRGKGIDVVEKSVGGMNAIERVMTRGSIERRYGKEATARKLREMLINEETLGLTATDGGSQFVLYTITLNYAVMFVAILPLLVVFPFVQKFFVKGVMIGAIKG